MSNKIKNIDSKKSNRSISAHKVDLSKLDSSEETMSLYTYPNEFLKLNLDKIRENRKVSKTHTFVSKELSLRVHHGKKGISFKENYLPHIEDAMLHVNCAIAVTGLIQN